MSTNPTETETPTVCKFLVRVTESVNHDYLIEATDEEEALRIYESYTSEQLRELDIDGDRSWDRPWDIERVEE